MIDLLLDIYAECNFFVYLLVAVCLLCFPAPRRKFFALRLVGGMIAGIALTYGYSLLGGMLIRSPGIWMLVYGVKYFFCFFLACGCIWLCFSMPFAKVLFYGICGYAVQHIAYSLLMIASAALEMAGAPIVQGTLLFIAVEFGVTAAVYLPVFFFYGKFVRRAVEDVQGKKLILPFSLLMAVTVVLCMLSILYTGEVRVVVSCYAIVLCVTILYAMYKVYEVGKLRYERQTARAVAAAQKEQYEVQKRNIDYINVKCHDLRKQLELLRGGNVSEEKLRQMQRSVTIYDSFARTGNRTLDAILSEKGLFCEQEGIRFTCMADGARLAFLDDIDLCAIFCNLIDNAVEAVMRIPERDKRLISLKVEPIGNMAHIGIFNNFLPAEGKGAFQTGKQDVREHGFGLKSVRMAVESYKGEMKVYAKNNVFNVNILLPVPAQTDGAQI